MLRICAMVDCQILDMLRKYSENEIFLLYCNRR